MNVGDWRVRKGSTLGRGVTPGPDAPTAAPTPQTQLSAATPQTQFEPFRSPGAFPRPIASHGCSPMCAFECPNSNALRHTAAVASPMVFSPAAQKAITPHERQSVLAAYAGSNQMFAHNYTMLAIQLYSLHDSLYTDHCILSTDAASIASIGMSSPNG